VFVTRESYERRYAEQYELLVLGWIVWEEKINLVYTDFTGSVPSVHEEL